MLFSECCNSEGSALWLRRSDATIRGICKSCHAVATFLPPIIHDVPWQVKARRWRPLKFKFEDK